MLVLMGYSGPVAISASLASIRNVSLLHADSRIPVLVPTSGSELDDDVSFVTPATTEALTEKPDAITGDVLRRLLFALNASDLVDSPEKLTKLIMSGYNFNNWPTSAGLRV